MFCEDEFLSDDTKTRISVSASYRFISDRPLFRQPAQAWIQWTVKVRIDGRRSK